jgi:ferritin-like metal-binding protein YciE
MAQEQLRQLVAQGVQALRAGSEVAKQATAEIDNDARDPALKGALQEGNKTSATWAQRIDRAAKEAGDAQNRGNPVLEALYKVSREIRQSASDDRSRDLGIIASGQLALHYWIAAFGTLRTYASSLGLQQIERDFQASLDEAKQQDAEMTQLAERMLADAKM